MSALTFCCQEGNIVFERENDFTDSIVTYSWLILGVKTCDTHKENKEVNVIDPNPNSSYKTMKNFTGFYTEGKPYFYLKFVFTKLTG